ncbi:vesicle-associated membrane protein-associated protein A [Protopterus annectens]|uniref:vesicle-associated membrane protein-associated protein A n=1 Tax=Protopterus annectens TaxID=7888 RepID=UPI001CFB8A77|nr:vesicle-associated membrane protein-associated protein A [Protopterus annectens]
MYLNFFSVMLQPFDYDPNEKSKHKFMVQTIFAPPNVTDMEVMWKDAKPEDLMDSKLRCMFEMPYENERVNDIEASKVVSQVSAPKPESGSGSKPLSTSLDDIEIRKVLEECKRLQAEVGRLSDENRSLKDDGLRLRKVAQSDSSALSTGSSAIRDTGSSALPSLLVVIAAIFIGFFLGKFIL